MILKMKYFYMTRMIWITIQRKNRHVRARKRVLAQLLASVIILLWTYKAVIRALYPPEQDLQHFRRSTDLNHYLDQLKVIIEPSTVACSNNERTLVVAIVTSAPSHLENRQAIRATWGKHLPTYFMLGIEETDYDRNMTAETLKEAKEHNDLIVYNLRDHYQNLTLKSVLMLQWTAARCPHVGFLFKTDDDVLVNPWTLETVLRERSDAALLGYVFRNRSLFRDVYHKWYVPRWMRVPETMPHHLSGAGYLLAGEHLTSILEAAKTVPLINMEDIYITYLVSNIELDLELVHDYRLSPCKPQITLLDCTFWTLAYIHSYTPNELMYLWEKVEKIAKVYEKSRDVCSFYKMYIEKYIVQYHLIC